MDLIVILNGKLDEFRFEVNKNENDSIGLRIDNILEMFNDDLNNIYIVLMNNYDEEK